jgi:glycine cleavage system H protein
MNFPENLFYTKDHEWIAFNDNHALVGITDFSQKELGDIVFLDIPTLGKNVKTEEVFGTVEAVKTVSDLYMPVSGVIIEVSAILEKQPELVNQNPYESWIIKVQLEGQTDKTNLLSADEYKKLIGADDK